MAFSTVNVDFLKRPGNYQVTKELLDEVITLKRFIDTTVDTLASGEWYKIFAVPANFVLLEAYVVAHTAEGAGDTIDIVDDDSDTTTFVSAAALNSTSAVAVAAARKRYAAAGFIVMKPSAEIATAKFEVIIRGVVIKTTD